MRFLERDQFISVAAILVVVLLHIEKGACDSICPSGIKNITASSGVLAYPSSGDYGINETKCWGIEVPDTYQGIYYFFNRLDIEICEGCECDGLQIVRSSTYSSLASNTGTCERLSDNYLEYRNPKGDFESATRMYVRFVSDDTVHRKGFNLSFVAQSYAGGKISYLNATEDETIDFGTPKVGIKNYPENYKQQWVLIVPEGRQVQIDFDIFELEESEKCKYDYLEIREVDPKMGEYQGPILTGRLCGSTLPSTIQSAGNLVWVQFMSDSNATTVYKGFKASFKAGQGRMLLINPSTLLLLSALLVIASQNDLF